MRTKINHVTVVTMDEQFHVYENGYVVLEGNTILETGEGEGPADADGTVDGKNGILMPGMINTHCHIPMIPFRSLGDDCPDRLRRFLFPLELEAMNRELIGQSTRSFCFPALPRCWICIILKIRWRQPVKKWGSGRMWDRPLSIWRRVTVKIQTSPWPCVRS